jgi:PAS domain-containing protein
VGDLGDDLGVGTAVLPPVLHTAPVACIVIDLAERAVVYANAAAVELTGGRVQLPVDVDAWGDAARLADLSPLSFVAGGEPVAGEPVSVHGDPDGQLWVTGFPLFGARCGLHDELDGGEDLGRRALVVLQKLVGTAQRVRRRLEVLRDRAVVATDMSFTITDPRRHDDPLVWVNPSFTTLTGYTAEEAVGRNCRFLQGPNTDPAAVRRIADSLRRRRPVTEVLLN